MALPKLYGERINKLLNFLKDAGEKSLVSKQVISAVYRKNIDRFADMTEVPVSVRRRLESEFGFSISSLSVVNEKSADFSTKALFKCTSDQAKLEAVSLAFHNHNSLCISSQVGCAFGCSFCATGKIGFKRQLTVSNITDQVMYFARKQRPGSISFMGQGEPLGNPKVFDAISALTNTDQFAMSPSRINVSTIGIIPGILKLNEVHPNCNLAYSLHSPFREERERMMPIEKVYPFSETFKTLDARITKTGNRIWIAYLLLKGINDSADHARALVELIKSRPLEAKHLYHVNLLPYNAARNVSHTMKKVDDISAFQRIIQKAGIPNSYRNSFGRSIDAACGQLYSDHEAGIVTNSRQYAEVV